MKILKLRLTNLNSLKGTFEIDFTDRELTGGGIFAITGRTGSGKTTLLDAITLALYGVTPRLSGKGEDTVELMTRGTGRSEAVVEFSTRVDGRTLVFRATWERHRAGGRPDGRLQYATMKLDQVTPRQPGDAWDAVGQQKVSTAIERITGLDFKRFTRTCLLAQGQFAAFLEAGLDERAKILEQITGTEIYSELSKAAYLRDKQERERLDLLRQRLQGVTLMPDEEFQALRERTDALARERQALEDARLTIVRQIQWVEQFEKLVQSRQSLEASQQALTAEQAAAAADLARLAEARRAEPLRPLFAQQEAARRAAAEQEAALAETRRRRPEAQAEQAQAEQTCRAAQTDLDAFTVEARGRRELIGRVRQLDQQRAGLAEQHNHALQQKNTLASQLATLEGEIAASTDAIARLAEQQADMAQRLAARQADAFLGSDLKALRELTEHRAAIERRLRDLETDLAQTAKVLAREEKKVRQLEAEIEKAEVAVAERQTAHDQAAAALAREFPRATAASLKKAVETAQKQETHALALRECGEEIRERKKALADHEAHQRQRAADLAAAQHLVETLEKQREHAEHTLAELEARQARAALEASLEEHRRALREGEPCPLCGATEHPYAAGDHRPPESEDLAAAIKTAKQALKKLDAELKKARQAEKNLIAHRGADEATREDHGKAIASLEKKWERILAFLDATLLAKAVEGEGPEADPNPAAPVGAASPDREPLGAGSAPAATDRPSGRDVEDRDASHRLSPDDEAALNRLLGAAGQQLAAAQAAFDRYTAAIESRNQAEAALNTARSLAQELATRLAAARGARDTAATRQQALQRQRDEGQAQLVELEARLLQTLATYGITAFDDDLLPTLEARWKSYQADQARQAALAQDEQRARQTLAAAQARKEGLTAQLATLEGTLADLARRLNELDHERRTLFGDRDPAAEEERLEAELAARQQRVQAAQQAAQEARLKVETLTTTETWQANELRARQAAVAAAVQAVADALAKAGYPDEATARAALLPPAEFQRLADLEKRLDERATRLKGELAQVARQIAEQEADRPTDRSLADLRAEEAALIERQAAKTAEWQASATALAAQENLRQQHAQLQQEIAAAERARRPWAKLNELIGSADGKAFQTFVQGLTFGNLVYLANQQLQRLNRRYLLANDGLELRVIDRFISETRATVKNLSGGEKFLASLALALGLAQMVGQNHQMDTLFIDEGFGSLDPQTLQIAMDALCTLPEQDKLVGLISHVEAIRDRLPARIEVQREGGGFSTIQGPGCRRLSTSDQARNSPG